MINTTTYGAESERLHAKDGECEQQEESIRDRGSKGLEESGRAIPLSGDGWFGVGVFGSVGPCKTLRQAMIRSGI